MSIHIGTSGFLYEHWRRRFYPPSSRAAELEYFAARFDTVELNVTFYRMPSSATFRSWAERVPAGFIFAVKASRYLTHIRRLQQPRESVGFLLDRARELGDRLGPILLQLPPDLEVDVAALAETLAAFPPDIKVALEPRHRSWFCDEVRDLLAERNAALCLADRRGPLGPSWRTADWSYLRFHGGRAAPRPCYAEHALEQWAVRLREVSSAASTGYVYFNNDHDGCALRDAAVFARALLREGFQVGRIPVVSDGVLTDPG